MNLQSWILLILIVCLCAFIVYKRFIVNDNKTGCKDCSCHNNNKLFNNK
ncbi:FeoB-associated Cys-rich membrane protein [Anaerococcus sp. Marseille-P9784]|nr:FeoB-associated Cys-rich membrane protein [Anaerococcus sp. Marseille-P9784]